LFDNVHAYFYENVLACYNEYEDRRSESKTGLSIDLRKAIVAATALFHFREHLPKQYKKSREEFAKSCLDYDLLGDICNASKHNSLTKHWKYLNSSESIKEIIELTKFNDSLGDYFFQEKIICIKLIDNSERDLFDILTKVLNM
jgi:hypothetical protein